MNKACFRRFAALMTVVSLLAGLLTACSSDTHRQAFAPSESEKLIIYTSHKEEVYGPIIDEFEARTGIWVEVVSGGSATLLEQIRLQSGTPEADIMFGGGVDLLGAYSDCFEAYEPEGSEYLTTDFKSTDNKWTAFSSLPIVIIYNNRLVYVNSVPDSWQDLLDERWKGKIAFADPGNSGTSYTSLVTLLTVMEPQNEVETMHAFIDNLGGKILTGSGEVTESVAAGTKLIGVTLEEAALKKQAAGADISIVYPAEGTSAVPDGCAIVKEAVHLENAQKFMDFIISDCVQQMLVELCSRRPVRGGVKISDERLHAIDEIDYDIDRATAQQAELLDEWNRYKEAGHEE